MNLYKKFIIFTFCATFLGFTTGFTSQTLACGDCGDKTHKSLQIDI